MAEKTTEQVLVSVSVDGLLAKTLTSNWPNKVRAMRRDATLGFVRDLYMAPIMTSDWTVVSDSPKYRDAEKMVYDSFVPQRRKFLRHAVRGLLDFGWQSFEKVFGFDDQGYVKIKKLKPLLQDITDILVNPRGDFIGVRNQPPLGASNILERKFWVDLSRDEAMLLYDDVEGTNWYGEPKMRRAEVPYDSWNACNLAADRFDKKMAGAHWVVHYPLGSTPLNGVLTDNGVIAQKILDAMESSGKIAIPQKLLDTLKDVDEASDGTLAWKIELLSANTTSASSYGDRQKYLDALKARALGIPERAVMEGEFGTKAEAEAHADFAIDNIEMGHQDILEQLNEDAVNQLLELNKGRHYRGHVKLVAMPLSDFKRDQLKELYMTYFQQPDGFAEEIDAVDWAAVREQLNIPVKKEHPDARQVKDDKGVLEGKGTPPPQAGGAPEGDKPAAAAAGRVPVNMNGNGHSKLRDAFKLMLTRGRSLQR